MSDEIVKQQLLQTLEKPQFEVWNSTSVSHLTLSLLGINGYEVSEISYQIFQNFIGWLASQAGSKTEDIDDLSKKIEGIFLTVNQKKQEGVSDEDLKNLIKNATKH